VLCDVFDEEGMTCAGTLLPLGRARSILSSVAPLAFIMTGAFNTVLPLLLWLVICWLAALFVFAVLVVWLVVV
jgi:hypothetical protein